FDVLGEGFFSVGQSESYYLALNEAGGSIRDRVLNGLRDVAANAGLFGQALSEPVTQESVLRSVTRDAVEGRFRRLARGDARLTRYAFAYQSSATGPSDVNPIRLEFDVVPHSSPPTNVHVLIGRNGVGKTHTLTRMLHALVADDGG